MAEAVFNIFAASVCIVLLVWNVIETWRRRREAARLQEHADWIATLAEKAERCEQLERELEAAQAECLASRRCLAADGPRTPGAEQAGAWEAVVAARRRNPMEERAGSKDDDPPCAPTTVERFPLSGPMTEVVAPPLPIEDDEGNANG